MTTRQLSKSEASERIKKLRQLIDDYRYHHHVLDESTMSEAAADSLKHQLTELETAYQEMITPDSPNQKVAGAPKAGFAKVSHQIPMISLSDVFNSDELAAWLERAQKYLAGQPPRLEFFCDIKMDGLACALIYQDGVFTQAVTRGDIRVGEDVTENVKTISNVPLRLRKAPDAASADALLPRRMPNTAQSATPASLPKALSGNLSQPTDGRVEVRGEIVIFKADFDQLNRDQERLGLPKFANPRNLAAGTIRQLDPSVVAARPLRFMAYDIVSPAIDTYA